MLVDAEDPDAVETVLVIDQDPLALSEDGVVGAVPRDAEPIGDPSDVEVGDHDPF